MSLKSSSPTSASVSAGVGSRSIRATITLTTLQAGIYHSAYATTVNARRAQAAGIYVDPDSKNRVISDTYTLSDVTATIIQKPFADGVALTDLAPWVFNKPRTDLFSVSDAFARTVDYRRTFSDGLALDDAAQIDKDYTGYKGNVFSFSDTQAYGFTKGLTDSVSFIDELQFDQSKELTDSIGVVDAPALQSSIVMTPDSVGFTDTAQFDQSKGLADSFGFTDGLQFDQSKGLADSFGFIHDLQLNQSKALTDPIGVQDSPALHPSIVMTPDSMAMSDVIAITHQSASSVVNATSFNVATLNS